MKKLIKRLKELGRKKSKVLITAHSHADPDAIGSILGLSKIMTGLGARVKKRVPESIGEISKNLLKKTGKEIKTGLDLDVDCIIVLDTSSIRQIKDLRKKTPLKNKEIIFIDHHHLDSKTKEKISLYYNDENAASTIEIILRINQELEIDLGPTISNIMLTGIITDTGRFKYANNETFSAVKSLIKYGAKYQDSLKMIEKPEDPSQKIARLKAIERTELHKSHDKWIIFSEIGAYESDAARTFINIGADIAIVGNQKEKKVRISARSKSGLASKTQIHLGELFSEIGKEFSGTGGGHAGAAGMEVPTTWENAKKKIFKKIKSKLQKTRR